MKLHDVIGVVVTAMLGAACSSHPGHSPVPAPVGSAAHSPIPEGGTSGIGAMLARAGYIGTPLRRTNGYRFLAAKIGPTPVTLLLDSGSPFDLLLDPSLGLDLPAGVQMTDVLSGYWTSTDSKGHWATVDRLTLGTAAFEGLEAKIEPSPVPVTRAVLGATLLISRGAIIDYATDTLYLLASTPPGPSAAAQPAGVRHPNLRAALEQAGQYRTFLSLMGQVGLMPLLEGAIDRKDMVDSIAWLGMRVRAAQLSGVGAMPPNDTHLQLTRQAVDQWRRGSNQRTAFVPTDTAFSRLPAETLRALRADTARLARLLRSHLFLGAAIDTSAMRTLIRGVGQPGPTGLAFGFHMLGSRIDVERLTSWEEGRVITRATIVQPDLRASNGVMIAHGIDRLLGSAPTPPWLGRVLTQQGYVGVPLYRREDGNGYLVQARVNDTPVRLDLETGAPVELVLDRKWAERLPSSDQGYAVSFDTVKLPAADVETADLSTRIGWDQSQGYRTGAGTVGSLLLAKYRARIDYAAGMLYLRTPSP